MLAVHRSTKRGGLKGVAGEREGGAVTVAKAATPGNDDEREREGGKKREKKGRKDCGPAEKFECQ